MEDWMSTLLWVTTGSLLMLILRIYRSVVDDIPSTHPATPRIFIESFKDSSLIIALSSALLSSPLPKDNTWSPANISTVCIAIWWAWTLWNSSRLAKEDNNPLTTRWTDNCDWGYMIARVESVTCTAQIYCLVSRTPTEFQSVTAIAVGIVSALLIHHVVLPITSRLTRKTEIELDDTLLELVR